MSSSYIELPQELLYELLLHTDNEGLTLAARLSTELAQICLDIDFLKRRISQNADQVQIYESDEGTDGTRNETFPIFLSYRIVIANNREKLMSYSKYVNDRHSYDVSQLRDLINAEKIDLEHFKNKFFEDVKTAIEAAIEERSALPDEEEAMLANDYIILFDGIDRINVILFSWSDDPSNIKYIVDDMQGFIYYQLDDNISTTIVDEYVFDLEVKDLDPEYSRNFIHYIDDNE